MPGLPCSRLRLRTARSAWTVIQGGRCSILWPLGHTIAKSLILSAVLPRSLEIGTLWCASMKSFPRSPYSASRWNLHTSQNSDPFLS